MSAQILWVVRAGRNDEARSLFLEEQHPVVALGWKEMPDLTNVPADRDAFKKLVAEVRPKAKRGAIPNSAGQIFRFRHEMTQGQHVLYPCKTDRLIYIGKVKGDYFYSPKNSEFPHQRSVEWLKSVSRLKFSQGALYEMNSALTIFQVKNYADEFFAALAGKERDVSVKEDPTVVQVQADIEETTSDFIIKTLAQELKGHPFAEFVAHLLNTMGYKTRISPEGADGGIDIIAHTDELGFVPPIIKVQVKSTEAGSIGDPVVTALYGKVDPKEFGLFVTLGTYSNQAKQFARNKANLRLIDGNELVNLIQIHYEKFDARYKSILPLKRIYVPDQDEPENDEE
jgi:restriction system protein